MQDGSTALEEASAVCVLAPTVQAIGHLQVKERKNLWVESCSGASVDRRVGPALRSEQHWTPTHPAQAKVGRRVSSSTCQA